MSLLSGVKPWVVAPVLLSMVVTVGVMGFLVDALFFTPGPWDGDGTYRVVLTTAEEAATEEDLELDEDAAARFGRETAAGIGVGPRRPPVRARTCPRTTHRVGLTTCLPPTALF